MFELKNQSIKCPHCGHTTNVTLDTTCGDQDFYEDCAACCHAIHLTMHIDEQHDNVQLVIDSE